MHSRGQNETSDFMRFIAQSESTTRHVSLSRHVADILPASCARPAPRNPRFLNKMPVTAFRPVTCLYTKRVRWRYTPRRLNQKQLGSYSDGKNEKSRGAAHGNSAYFLARVFPGGSSGKQIR